jgi:hypothetical protein
MAAMDRNLSNGLMILTYQRLTAVLLLIYGSLFLSDLSVLVCHFENVRTNIKFLVKLGNGGSKIREMLVQVYRDNAMKKTALYMWVTHLSKGRESVADEER